VGGATWLGRGVAKEEGWLSAAAEWEERARPADSAAALAEGWPVAADEAVAGIHTPGRARNHVEPSRRGPRN